jgi:hypothetical protein
MCLLSLSLGDSALTSVLNVASPLASRCTSSRRSSCFSFRPERPRSLPMRIRRVRRASASCGSYLGKKSDLNNQLQWSESSLLILWLQCFKFCNFSDFVISVSVMESATRFEQLGLKQMASRANTISRSFLGIRCEPPCLLLVHIRRVERAFADWGLYVRKDVWSFRGKEAAFKAGMAVLDFRGTQKSSPFFVPVHSLCVSLSAPKRRAATNWAFKAENRCAV